MWTIRELATPGQPLLLDILCAGAVEAAEWPTVQSNGVLDAMKGSLPFCANWATCKLHPAAYLNPFFEELNQHCNTSQVAVVPYRSQSHLKEVLLNLHAEQGIDVQTLLVPFYAVVKGTAEFALVVINVPRKRYSWQRSSDFDSSLSSQDPSSPCLAWSTGQTPTRLEPIPPPPPNRYWLPLRFIAHTNNRYNNEFV